MGKYNCNRKVFSEITNENEAYWLGFILADGHNHQNKTLRVDIKDKGHLEGLSKLIYPDGNKPIKERDLGFGTVYYFHCGISDVVINLSNHGVVPNKSKIASLPILSDEMYKHFIRGLFDGDGNLYYTTEKKYRRYMFSIVGNLELMEGVKKVVKTHTGIDLGLGKMKMIHRVYKKGNQQILTLLNWLYEDSSVYLDRKNKIYREMVEYYKNK